MINAHIEKIKKCRASNFCSWRVVDDTYGGGCNFATKEEAEKFIQAKKLPTDVKPAGKWVRFHDGNLSHRGATVVTARDQVGGFYAIIGGYGQRAFRTEEEAAVDAEKSMVTAALSVLNELAPHMVAERYATANV